MAKQEEKFGVGIEIKGNKCGRCGYEWVPRDFEEIPETCPKCRSPYWNKKRVKQYKGAKK